MGQLIIFEGLDGSGKGTQTKLTAQRLQEQGKDLRQITFPNYESDSSALVKMYLAGAFGEQARRRQRLRGLQLLRRRPLCQLQDRLGRVLPRGRPGPVRPVHHLQRRAPVLQAAADALGRILELAVRPSSTRRSASPTPDAVIYLAVDPEVSQRLHHRALPRPRGRRKDIQEKDTRVPRPQPRRRRVLRPHAGLAPHRVHRAGGPRTAKSVACALIEEHQRRDPCGVEQHPVKGPVDIAPAKRTARKGETPMLRNAAARRSCLRWWPGCAARPPPVIPTAPTPPAGCSGWPGWKTSCCW